MLWLLRKMSSNPKYIGIHASAEFYDDAPVRVGSMVCIECYEDVFQVVKLNWGAEEDYERSRNGEVEMSWRVIGDALERLKKTCNNAKTPEDVVEYLKQRFAPYGKTAHYELLHWLEKKQIMYYYTEC
jgi:hypothetical protein